MVDLSSEMAALAERLGPAHGAVARVVQFVAAEEGEGTSTLAREFAYAVSRHAARGVWLIELDLMKGEQYATLAAETEHYGRLSAPGRASPSNTIFFQVTPGRGERLWPSGGGQRLYGRLRRGRRAVLGDAVPA